MYVYANMHICIIRASMVWISKWEWKVHKYLDKWPNTQQLFDH